MKKIKPMKAYAPVDNRGRIWARYLYGRAREVWRGIESENGLNKCQAKVRGLRVIKVFIVPADGYEIWETPDNPDEDAPIDERAEGMREYAENKKSFNRKVISEAGGEG